VAHPALLPRPHAVRRGRPAADGAAGPRPARGRLHPRLLGSGILLILLGQDSSQQNLVSALGLGVSWVSVHQGFFVVWCGATGLHLLGRIIPALRISFGSERVARLPGTWVRAALVGACAVAAVALAVALVHADGSWHGFSAFGSGDVGDH
jgi:hypothetical protein